MKNKLSFVMDNDEQKEKKKRKGKSGGDYFKEYCDSSGIHGFKYLTEKRSLGERILWVFLIICAVIACCYLISRIYSKYESSPVIVSFATKESPIYTIPFPAVTFCPIVKANKALLNFTDICHKKEDNISVDADDELSAQYMSMICDCGAESFSQNKTFTEQFFHTLHEMQPPFDFTAMWCRFLGIEFNCADIFTPIILDGGICYTANMLGREDIFRENVVHFMNYHTYNWTNDWNIENGYPPGADADVYPTRALLSGAGNALDILFVQYGPHIDYLCIEDSESFTVSLHAPHTIPQVEKHYFQVPLDSSVLAVVQPNMMSTSEEVKKFSPADRECYFSTEKPLKFFKIYTQDNCRLECLTNHTLERCGCVNFFMPRENSTPICGTGNIKCMEDAQMDLKVLEVTSRIPSEKNSEVEIYCDCMPSCTKLSYELEETQTPWNWRKQFHARRMDKLYNVTEMDTDSIHFSKLSVFFKQEQFLTLERNELYGPTDFLANFGGLLGLFTGFSLLSLVEILYFLTVRICCNVRLYNVWTGLSE